jgi:hypothetical protein
MEITKDSVRAQFFKWIKTQAGKDAASLDPLVQACLEDAVDRMVKEFEIDPPDPAKEHETMKRLLDYWSSNVYLIIERGVASDMFRGAKVPPTVQGKQKLLQEFYDIRNDCYAKYFN